MGRKSLKEGQQKKIIEAFYNIAIKEGIENTSFGKVAKELDMHPSLVVHYFSNKEEMLIGLIDFIISSYEQIYQPENVDGSSLERLIKVLNNIFSRKWNAYIDDSIFYNCYALIFRNPLIKSRFKEMHLLLREWLKKLIQDCVDQRLLVCEDPAHASDLIFVISDGAYYLLSMIDDPAEYVRHEEKYRIEAFRILGLDPSVEKS